MSSNSRYQLHIHYFSFLICSFISLVLCEDVICNGPIPNWANAYPPPWSAAHYQVDGLKSLCAHKEYESRSNLAPPNLGGICVAASTSRPVGGWGSSSPIYTDLLTLDDEEAFAEELDLAFSDSDDHTFPDNPWLSADSTASTHLIFPWHLTSPIYRGLLTNDRARALRWHCIAYCHCRGQRGMVEEDDGLLRVNEFLRLDVRGDRLQQLWYLPAPSRNGMSIATRVETRTLVPLPRQTDVEVGEVQAMWRGKDNYRRRKVATCGMTCEGPGACSGGCDCVPYDSSLARRRRANVLLLGAEIVLYALAVCAFAEEVYKVEASHRRYSGLGRRDMHSGPACVCNATYISAACCGSATGIVWESPDAKIGELRGRGGGVSDTGVA